MKKILFLVASLFFIVSAQGKEILVSRNCDRFGCNEAYVLTGKDMVPYVKPTREQLFREDLENEIKQQRFYHPEYATLNDEEVVKKILKEKLTGKH